jgi:hypothetical protein
MVDKLDINIFTVGKLDVVILTVGKWTVDKRAFFSCFQLLFSLVSPTPLLLDPLECPSLFIVHLPDTCDDALAHRFLFEAFPHFLLENIYIHFSIFC